MKIIGLMLVRNEEWCLRATLPVALSWCDELVILDHGSIDSTPHIIRQYTAAYPGRIVYERHELTDTPWPEMDLRARSLDLARIRGATHIGIIDADEAITANMVPHMRRWCGSLGRAEGILLGMVSPFDGLTRLRVDGYFGERSRALVAFKDDGLVTWSPGADGYQLHSRTPRHLRRAIQPIIAVPCNDGGMIHLQFASMRRLRAKSAWYKVLECIQNPKRQTVQALNTQYDWALQMDTAKFRPVPFDWFSNMDLGLIDLDAESWQERELRSMLAKIRNNEISANIDGINLHGIS